jgi:hypothetical protein
MKYSMLILAFLLTGLEATAQEGRVTIAGQELPYMIDSCGDTILIATLSDVSISSFRKFKDDEEYKRYRYYRQCALKVYPYAVEAIKLFRELEYATVHMKDRHRKKYVKQLHKDLKEQFTDPLKGLTKIQGMILIKMIEKELDTPLYFLIKDLRNGFTATYWSTIGSLFGHKLRDGYTEGQDPILDAVLSDMDISYKISGVR